MASLMHPTIEEGTGWHIFGLAINYPVLSHLLIRGKSATINYEAGHRVDWFVVWARPKPGGAGNKNLKLAVIVVILYDALIITFS